MPTRQQRRARARTPAKTKKKGSTRRGQVAFVATLLALLVAGGAAVAVFQANPRPRQHGAIINEHWHADYAVDICGKRLQPYPHVEGEIHTHGDGLIHIHPHTQAFARQNANLGNFFLTLDTTVGALDGKRFIQFPNGQRYTDGDSCTPGGPPERLQLFRNGSEVADDPASLVVFNGDDIVVRFGPPATEVGGNPMTIGQTQEPEPASNGEQPPGQPAPGQPEPDAGLDAGAGTVQ